MLAPVRTSAPASAPVSLAEAKASLRVDFSDDDALITSLIAAAVDHLDGWSGTLGRALVTQSWKQDFGGFGAMRLPVGPVASIDKVEFFDSENASQTVDGTVYTLRTDALGGYVDLQPGQSWPVCYARPDAVRVTYVAGAAVADVPAAIKTAILLMVRDLYVAASAAGVVKRETVEGVSTTEYHDTSAVIGKNPAVEALIAPFRRVGL